ncbi:MAG: pre-peptidase C-terminal domain-containing protein, partial [Planctomycetota bacterium]
TDAGDTIFERGAELNNAGYDTDPVDVTLLPPADLVIGTVTVPADSAVGAPVSITYTVQNQGVNPARGRWNDSLFLSNDSEFSLDDVALGVVQHEGDVPGGSEYSETLITSLPGVIPGDYHIIVRSDIRNAIVESDETNNIDGSLDVFAIDLPILELGVPTTGTLAATQSLFYQIELTEGDSVRFVLDQLSDDSTGELFVRQGQLPTRGQFDFAANTPFQNDPSVVIPVLETGTYFVMAYGGLSAGGGDFSLTAETVPLSVFDVTTDTIGQDGAATVKVSGARFQADTLFSLVDPIDASIVSPAVDVIVEDSVTAYVTFAADDVPQGVYDIVAQNDLATARLAGGITLDDTLAGDILVSIDGAPRVRPDRLNPFRVQYRNDGNTDFESPLLVVENPDGLDLGFTSEDMRQTPIHLIAVSPDGPTDILRPDVLGSIPMLFRSTATGTVNMPVRPIRASDTRVISETEWIDINLSIRPIELSDQEWADFWSRVQPRIGPTWGSYVRFLQDLHNQTEDLGIRRGDVRSMMAAIYEEDPQYRPSSAVSGRLLNSLDETPLADVPIAAYLFTETGAELRGATTTAADGSFTFAALAPGEYYTAIDLEGYYFDSDRDGETDNAEAEFTVGSEDVSGLDVFVVESPQEEPGQSDPDFAVDSDGNVNLVYAEDGQLWHAIADASGNWIQ